MPALTRLDVREWPGYNQAVRRYLSWLILLSLILGGGVGWWRYYEWREHRFDSLILGAARRYGVEPALVKAVVWRESGFDPLARGSKHEIGLMQLRAAAAREWAQAERIKSFSSGQLLDPATNTLAGAWYLGKLLKRYQQTDDPLAYALADYNAGRGNVLRWNKGEAETNAIVFLARVDFPGTRKYVNEVARRCRKYQPELKQAE